MMHHTTLVMKPVCPPCWKARVGRLDALILNAVTWPPDAVCHDCEQPLNSGQAVPTWVKVRLDVPERR